MSLSLSAERFSSSRGWVTQRRPPSTEATSPGRHLQGGLRGKAPGIDFDLSTTHCHRLLLLLRSVFCSRHPPTLALNYICNSQIGIYLLLVATIQFHFLQLLPHIPLSSLPRDRVSTLTTLNCRDTLIFKECVGVLLYFHSRMTCHLITGLLTGII